MPFLKYAAARIESERKEMLFRHYVADSLHIAYNLNMRYADVIDPYDAVDEVSGEEIINRIISKIEEL